MNNIYEEAYKEAERKIKKLSEDFKKDLDKIFKECTKNKPEDLSNLSTNKKYILKIEEENTKLKELLKECKEVMSTGGYIFATVKQVKRARKLLENIDQALGEE